MFPARNLAPSRRIAASAAALAFAFVAMLAQIASYTHPELIAHVPGSDNRPTIAAVPMTGSGTLAKENKTQRCCDADDDADDDDDDDCAGNDDLVGTIELGATQKFARRYVSEIGLPRPMKLLLFAPKNSPPTA